MNAAIQKEPATLARQLAERFASLHDRIAEIETQLKNYQHIAEASPLPTALVARDSSQNVFVNQAYAKMLECNPDELLNGGWKSFVSAHALSDLVTAWESFYRSDAEKFNHDAHFTSKDTRRGIAAHVVGARIPDDGFVIFIVPDSLHFSV